MEKDSIQLHCDGPVASMTITRPESLNALNQDVLTGLLLSLDKISLDPEIRVVTVTGAGEKAFVAGADIATMNQLGPRAIADYVELGQRVMRRIETFPLPVIAIINGFALGGGLELALACDMIIASEQAKVGQPEVNLGIIPGFGGTQRLVQRSGVGVARRLCLTGEILPAGEALRMGIVDLMVPHGDLAAKARELALTIASRGPLAVRGAKAAIRRAGEGALLAGLRHEVEEFLHLFASADREEGMTAFLQKRQPVFKSR